MVVHEGGVTCYYEHKKIAKGCHGTGDVYASAFVGALVNGFGAYEAAVLAANYTVKSIELTQDNPEHWYGVKFELALPEFIRMLEKICCKRNCRRHQMPTAVPFHFLFLYYYLDYIT